MTPLLKTLRCVLCLIFVATLSTVAVLHFKHNARLAHLHETALEIASIAELRHPYIVANNAGTRLLVNMDSENGTAVYLFDVPTRKLTLLHEDSQSGYDWRQYKMLGWSPDDGLLAYGHQAAPKKNDDDNSDPGDLVIADGTSGQTLATIRVSEAATNSLFQFTWLSSNSFAYIKPGQDLHVYEQKPEGWIETRVFTNATGGNPYEAQSFAGLSPTAVTWRMRETLWSFDVTTGFATKLWGSFSNDVTTNTLLASSYSHETGKFLLVCYDRAEKRGERQSLYDFDPITKTFSHVIPVRQGILPDNPPAWINGHQGYEFLTPERSYCTLWISPTLGTNPATMFRAGEVRTAVVRGDHMFIAGTLTNEPPGVWDYNIKSGSLECILSAARRGLQHTECVPFEVTTITNVAGQAFSYHLWKPANFSPKRKYPLVLGNSPYSWTPFPLAAANAGYFFVTVDRPSWMSPMDDWTEKLMTGYKDLAKNPNIDTNRVFLCGRSVESSGVTWIYSQNPRLWKGVIFFDPAGPLPAISIRPFPKIFIASGELEHSNILKAVKTYKEKASDAGVDVTLVILKGAGHVSYGRGAQEQRIPALMDFLLMK